jgi:DNA ligase-1
MERLTRLYLELGETTRTAEKVAALERYFAEAPPQDAAWALFFLTGRKLKRVVSYVLLHAWAAEEADLPLWLVDECHDAVGDFAETLALILPDSPRAERPAPALHELVEERLVPLPNFPEDAKCARLVETWRELDHNQRLVWNKIITGEFRVGVARTLVVRAVAAVAGVPQAIMAHRLMGHWEPTAEDYSRLLSGDAEVAGPGQPYPFFLASPLTEPLESLGARQDWLAEWKWDGIRAQLIRRRGEVLVWSRGEELITDQFPEVRRVGESLPDGTVLDGEILACEADHPLPFAALQRRLGRKTVQANLWDAATVVFMAYDLLEADGEDWRARPLVERRAGLEQLPRPKTLRLSPVIDAATWEDLARLQREARSRSVEGLMLKRLASPYGVGRTRGDWWKWKIDPYTIDAVLIYAQRGHGRRASLFTDYTFGVWDKGEPAPLAKAYSGLTDEEIREVDAFVPSHTTERIGPVHVVTPVQVFEIAFQRIQASNRHKSGVAVRFPRIARWRRDKRPEEADTLEVLRKLLDQLYPRMKRE